MQEDAPSYEVLIVDNASDDTTAAIAERFVRNDPARYRLLRENRPGSYAARNCGLSAAHGTYLLFTDADCRPGPRWVTTLHAALAQGAALVGGPILPEGFQTGLIARYAKQADILGQAATLARGFLQTANLGVSAEAARAIGGFDADLYSGGDADFCWRLAKAFGHRPVLTGADGAVAHHHRETLRELWKQFRRYGHSDVDLCRRHGGSVGREGLKLGLDFVRVLAAPVVAVVLAPIALVRRDGMPCAAPLLRALRILARRRGQWIAWRTPARRHRA